MSNEVEYLEGGIAVDDRGQIQFCNAFDLKNIRRLYVVSNHDIKSVRAWHAHKKEIKYAFVVSGVAIVAVVKIDNWVHPDKNAQVNRYVLSASKPGVLKIPAGYANGFKALTPDTKIMFFSMSTLEESLGDDYRFDAYYWDAWTVKDR